MKQALMAVAAVFITLSLSCQNHSPPSEPQLIKENPPPEESPNHLESRKSLGIFVTDEFGQLIPNVQLLIGSATSNENPWITTDSSGHFTKPLTWTTPQDVTFEAPGFVRLTLKAQMPEVLSYVTLRRKSQLPQLSVRGTVSGVKTKDKDGFIDFAILLNSMTKADILNFNVNKVVSPWNEKISALGFELPVPQNIFLPKQKETYFLSFSIEKPWFIMPYDSYGMKSIFSLRGRFPFKKILNELQNKKPYFELINYFEMASAGSLEYDFTKTSTAPNLDTTLITLDKSFSTTAPAVDTSQVILGISAFKDKNFYQPLDIKYMQSKETTKFKTSQTNSPFFIGVLKNKDEFSTESAQSERMSISVDVPKLSVSYLPLTKDPEWISTTELKVDLPSMVDSGFSEQGMVVVVSEMQNLTLPDGKILKYKLPLWEIHSEKWSSTVQFPELDFTSSVPKRVEVTLLATEVDNSGQQNPITLISSYEERLETATHLTKSARDY